jgi:hypothetical protein
MTITLGHFVTVAACLFTLAIVGIFLNRKGKDSLAVIKVASGTPQLLPRPGREPEAAE